MNSNSWVKRLICKVSQANGTSHVFWWDWTSGQGNEMWKAKMSVLHNLQNYLVTAQTLKQFIVNIVFVSQRERTVPELGWVLMALPARHKKLVNCSLGHPGASNMHSHRMRLCWCPVCCSAHGRMVCAVYKIRQSDFLLRSGSVKSDHMHLSVIRAVHFLPPARDALWFHSIME